jgi:hypothetical protein
MGRPFVFWLAPTAATVAGMSESAPYPAIFMAQDDLGKI